jgi:nucleoside-diphosphate-sugar epimerase
MLRLERVAIVGATGATGIHLTRELTERGTAVRVVSRSRAHLDRAFTGTEVDKVAADATDAAQMRAAVEGCDLVVDCVGLPADRMADHPVTARAIIAAAADSGARSLHVSSFWGFLPLQRLPVDETHPRAGGNAYILARRAAEDVMLAGGAAVIHLPDFFGPHVGASSHQGALADAAAGKAMSWIGQADTPREAVYVPDAMRTAAELMVREEAYGQSWVFPGGGPVTAEDLAEIAGRHLHRRVKVRAAGPSLVRLVSLFSRDLRAFLPMVPHYVKPINYDASKLGDLLGEVRITPYEEAVPATLDWMRQRAS